jgi:hypothetical protein
MRGKCAGFIFQRKNKPGTFSSTTASPAPVRATKLRRETFSDTGNKAIYFKAGADGKSSAVL